MSTVTMPEREAPPTRSMDFSLTVARSVLKEAVNTLAAVTLSKTTLTVINCIKLEVLSDRAILVGTNLDTTLTLTIPVSSYGQGATCIPAKRLGDILANLDSAHPVTIAVTSRGARITAGRAKFDVPTMDVDEFPMTPEVADGQSLEVNAAAFVDRITRANRFSFTVDPQKGGRENLRTVCIDITSAGVVAVATTGNILARIRIGDAPEGAKRCDFLIPNISVAGIARLFAAAASGATVAIRSDGNRMVLSCGDRSATVSLANGPYPTYESVIPKDVVHRMICNRESFIAGVRRVMVAAEGETNRIRLTLNGSGEALLSAKTSDAGASEDILALASYNGPASAAALFVTEVNAALLLTALDALEGEAIEATLGRPERAIVFRIAGSGETDLALVMPLRIA